MYIFIRSIPTLLCCLPIAGNIKQSNGKRNIISRRKTLQLPPLYFVPEIALFSFLQKTLRHDSYFEARSHISSRSSERMCLHYVWCMCVKENERQRKRRESSLAELLSSLNVPKWVREKRKQCGFWRINKPVSFGCLQRRGRPVEAPLPHFSWQRLWWSLITPARLPGSEASDNEGRVSGDRPHWSRLSFIIWPRSCKARH